MVVNDSELEEVVLSEPKEGIDTDDNEKTNPMRQFIAGGTVNILSIILGTILGWTSSSLRHLEKADSPIPITTDENSWITSLMPLAAAFGPLGAGYSADKFGRKTSLYIIAIPIVISYILLAAADSVWMLYLGRIIAGLSLGATFTVMPMYTAEIAEKQYRGALGSLIQFTIAVGLIYDYSIGPFVPFMWLSILCQIFPVIFLVIFAFMPETPHYYLKKGREEDARKSLMWLRAKGAAGVEKEFQLIKTEIAIASQTEGGIKDIFASKANKKALFLCLGILFFQQFSGNNLVQFNAEAIFARAGGSLSPELSTIVTALANLLASGPNSYFVEKLGRRFLLIGSGVGMAVSLGVLGLVFFLQENGTNTDSFSFLPVMAVFAFLIFYAPGFGPLPWTVMGEMFPANIKAVASTICASISWALAFLITRFYNDLVDSIGDSYTFWIFAICCAAAAAFVGFLLPETKGKTLAEIQEALS